MRGRRSGNWERVEAASRQARLALGRDPASGDDYGGRSKPRSPLPPPPSLTRIAHSLGVGVLTIGEAATRLGLGRAELEAMIARGHVETLPTDFVRVIPSSEVERLQRAAADGSRS